MSRQTRWLVILATLTGAGCASFQAQRAHDRALAAAVGAYRHRQPVEKVWPEVRRLLADRNLKLAGTDAEAAGQSISTLELMISVARETSPAPGDGLTLETAWSRAAVRWRAVATPDQGGCRVVFTRIEENTTDHGHDGRATRDFAMELDLIRRLDPEGASRIDDAIDPAGTASDGRPAPTLPADPPPTAPARAIRVE